MDAASNTATVEKTGQALYMACVDHLTRLERALEKLKSIKSTGPRVEKLDELNVILNEVSNFLKEHASPEKYQSALSDIEVLTEKMGRLRKLLVGRSWDAFKSLLGAVDLRGFDIKMTYEEVRTDFMAFFVQHLVSRLKTFDVENSQKQAFLESVDSFSQELERVW